MLGSVSLSSFVIFVGVVLVLYNVIVFIHFSRLVKGGSSSDAPSSVSDGGCDVPDADGDDEDSPTGYEPDVCSPDEGSPSDGAPAELPASMSPSGSEGESVPVPDDVPGGVLTEDMVLEVASPSDDEIDDAFYALENSSTEPPEDTGDGEPVMIPASELPGESDYSLIRDSLSVVSVDEDSLTDAEREALELAERLKGGGAESFLSDEMVDRMEELRRMELEEQGVPEE